MSAMSGHPIRDLEARLQGWPDTLLTVALVGAGALLILAAFTAPTTLKAILLAWVVFP